MGRCPNIDELEVHHLNFLGGNTIDNAKVLCQKCHENTPSYGVAGRDSPPEFSQEIKDLTLKNAGYQCQCTNYKCSFH